MKSRWISMTVCLLYLSVSTVFAGIHRHQDDALKGHPQCAACAWHYVGQIDVPEVAISISLPPLVPSSEIFEISLLQELSPKIHPSRGPPAFPV